MVSYNLWHFAASGCRLIRWQTPLAWLILVALYWPLKQADLDLSWLLKKGWLWLQGNRAMAPYVQCWEVFGLVGHTFVGTTNRSCLHNMTPMTSHGFVYGWWVYVCISSHCLCKQVITQRWSIFLCKYIYTYASYLSSRKLECDLGLCLDARRACDSSFLSRPWLVAPAIPRMSCMDR